MKDDASEMMMMMMKMMMKKKNDDWLMWERIQKMGMKLRMWWNERDLNLRFLIVEWQEIHLKLPIEPMENLDIKYLNQLYTFF